MLTHPVLFADEDRPQKKAKPDPEDTQSFYGRLGVKSPSQIPVVYTPSYSLHGTDGKPARNSGYYVPNDSIGAKVFEGLVAQGLVSGLQGVVEPRMPQRRDLLLVHPSSYLNDTLLSPATYKQFMGLGEAKLANLSQDFESWMNTQLLQASGSILAAHLALEACELLVLANISLDLDVEN
eukprot:c17625_g1_i2.p2 GENE.c17625_g1_i2~~c17625_g1_i2.p2  ORF type:complete len:180 (+),score=28.12 c17625_g1_i2:35-574(+)